jgi:hypothetical protein
MELSYMDRPKKKMDASGKTKWRIVVDYRKINEKTIDDRYPLPFDILDKLGKCQYFTTLPGVRISPH